MHTHALSTKAVFTVFSEYPKPKVRAEFTHRQQPLLSLIHIFKAEKVEKTETAVKAESKTVKAEKPAEKKTTAKK